MTNEFSFNFTMGVQEYTCTLTRSISDKKPEAKYQAFGTRNLVWGQFVVTMTFATAKRVIYTQIMTGDAAASLLSRRQIKVMAIADEAMSIPFDIRFVKRMAKRAMATRLESLRLDGKRKAAYGWGISNGRKRTSVINH